MSEGESLYPADFDSWVPERQRSWLRRHIELKKQEMVTFEQKAKEASAVDRNKKPPPKGLWGRFWADLSFSDLDDFGTKMAAHARDIALDLAKRQLIELEARYEGLSTTPEVRSTPNTSPDEVKRQKRAAIEKQRAEIQTAYARLMAEPGTPEARLKQLQNALDTKLRELQQSWDATW